MKLSIARRALTFVKNQKIFRRLKFPRLEILLSFTIPATRREFIQTRFICICLDLEIVGKGGYLGEKKEHAYELCHILALDER